MKGKESTCILMLLLVTLSLSIHPGPPERHGFEPLGPLQKIKPTTLLTPQRFDITAKHLYAKHRELSVQSLWSTNLYKNHLLAVNELYEDWPEQKIGVGSFRWAFHAVLNSIKNNGFNETESIIPIDTNNNPRDGAHRVAACILYDVKPICKQYDYHPDQPHFSAQFFADCGLSQSYLDAMALHYCKLKKNVYIVLIMPAARGHENEVLEILNAHGAIVYRKNVYFNQTGAFNLILNLYPNDPWIGDWRNGFRGAWHKTRRCFPSHAITTNPLRVFVFECESTKKVRSCKQNIRELFDIREHSAHTTDTHQQTQRLARILFVENSIRFFNNIRPKRFEKNSSLLSHYKQWLYENDVDTNCFCIVGDATLSACGQKDCDTLDYLCHGYAHLSPDKSDIANYNKKVSYRTRVKDDIIFDPRNHFWYENVKFALPVVVKPTK